MDVTACRAGDWPVIGWMGIGCDEVAWIGVIVVVLSPPGNMVFAVTPASKIMAMMVVIFQKFDSFV